jgi:GT2 family glycosyltransferase
VADLTVVIVSWNVRELLRRCLHSVLATTQYHIEIIVVDNASTDGSVEMIRTEFPAVHLVANNQNKGFTAANNQGLELSSGRHLLLLNPDTEVVGDALTMMLNYMEAHPQAGALGPQLLNSDGSLQPSRRRFPTFATALMESTVIQEWWPDNRTLRRYYMADTADEAIQPVDWVVGACLLVRREAYEEVGALDEGYFMYSEELDWCKRLKQAGWEVVYLPTATIVHHEGKSSEQVVPARHIHFQSSKIRYFRKHHGALQAEALRAFLLGTYVYQWVREGMKWLVGHKRPLRKERLDAYQQVLGSGLVEHDPGSAR